MNLISILETAAEAKHEKRKMAFYGEVEPRLVTAFKDPGKLLLSFVPIGRNGSEKEPAIAQVKLTPAEVASFATMLLKGLEEWDKVKEYGYEDDEPQVLEAMA